MALTPYADVYARARQEIAEPERLFAELDRVLGAAERELGERYQEAVRLAEMALVARVAGWRLGPPQPAIRQAAARLADHLGDPVALGLGLRLAAAWARLGRVDDEAHRLAGLSRRLLGTGLPHPEQRYAEEAARWLDEAAFLPSPDYVYELVRERPVAEVCAEANAQLTRGNPGFAAALAELRLVRALDDWYVGPSLPNVERALRRYREEHPPDLQPLAVVLARAYLEGAFVDLRARDLVLAVLEGAEAQLLAPDLAVALRTYVDRDRFDYPPAALYQRVGALDPDALRQAVREHVRQDALPTAQQLCELALVRRFDPWYVGDPAVNVRKALRRYLAAPREEDRDADWAADWLAGLYLATLQGAPHARELVYAACARQSLAPTLRESLQAAGIPGDVDLPELLRLYKEVVDVEARAAAFRGAAAGEGGPGPYEQAAYEEVLRALEDEEPGSPLAGASRALGDLVEGLAPDVLTRSVAAAVESALRLALTGTGSLLRRDRLLSQLARRDPALRTLDRLRQADLRLLDEVAREVTRENLVAAALEGLGCGLGGPTLLLVDLPMLVMVNLNAVASLATIYGFDADDPAERELIATLTAGGRDALRQVAAQEAGAGGNEELYAAVRRQVTGNAALALHAAAGRIAARLAGQKLAQLVPLFGGAVGAGVNYHFTRLTVESAGMAYRLRWLLRRWGHAPGA